MFALLQRLLGLFLLDCLSQHVGDGLDKIDVVLGKVPPLVRVGAQNAKGACLPCDDHANAADDMVLVQQGRATKARFRAQILHDNRFVGQQGKAGLRIRFRADRLVSDQPFMPAHAGL